MRLSLASRLFIFALLLGFFTVTPAKGIELYGRIRGTVTDPSGAVISGATVTVVNDATGISRTMLTGADGNYQAFQLPAPSTYSVKVEMKGFKSYEAHGIPLGVEQTYVLNVALELGAITQRVTVEAAPVQVEKTSIELGATISGTEIVDMPLNGRNWVTLQQTLPGVVAAADARGNYATNGSQPDQNSYLINGIDSNDLPLNTPLVIPSPDAIGEVRMVTNTINPEYGRNSGAIMDAVTKGGANRFHGDGFEFFRDTSLDARNFFQPSSVVFHQNQFGGTIGGPIKKDHTFFFFSYQGTRNRAPAGSGATTVFTPAQRNGAFTDINSTTGPATCTAASIACLSPIPLVGDNGTTYPAGTSYSTIFANGTIPSADFNPLAVSLLTKFVPPPNCGTTGCSEYDFVPFNTGVDDQYLTRIDENFSSKDSLWGSWLWERHPTTDMLPFTGATLPGFPEVDRRHIQSYSVTWNHTFGGGTLNEARFGYTRFNFDAVEPVNPLNPASVGFTGITPQIPSEASWPVIALTGYFTLGFSNNGPQPRLDATYQVDDNFTRMYGNHTFKMGFNMRRFEVYNPFGAELSGSYGFGGTGLYSTGDMAADFLLGFPDTYAQGGGDVINARGREYYSYFQDQYKVRKNLTLTFGTGWQVDTPTVDLYDNDHSMTAFRPGQTSTVFPNAPTDYLFEGDPGINATGTTKYAHFGPRFGFAWSPGSSGKWAIRGGYGIYFNRELEEQTLQFLNAPPFSITSHGASACTGYSPSFANPFQDIATGALCPNPFPVPANPPSNVNFTPYLPIWIYAVDPATSVPYSQNFNLTFERQLSPTTIVTAAYVGELGRKEVILRELNPGLDPSACAADPLCVAYRYIQGWYAPQYFQYNPTVFPGIGNNQSTGISNYNALQVTFTHHASHGLELYSIYSWSHAMDNGSGFENSGFGGGGFGGYGQLRATNPFNQTLYNYGPSEYDATQRFAVSFSYRFPTPHISNWAGKRLVGGWRMTGITALQSGFPLDVIDSSYRSLTCTEINWTACWDIPDMPSSPQYANPRTSSFTNTVTVSGLLPEDHYLFNPNTFVRAPIGVQGNAGRNPLRGPGLNNFDWALFKDTQITESTRIELRFEFYNLFNHTQFSTAGAGAMTTDINSPDFGRVLAAQNPRLIQLAAKFYF
jgi:hypothetical protein